MNEKSREAQMNPEVDLGYLRKKLEEAEAELRRIEAEREEIMSDLIAGEKGAAKNFNDYLRRRKEAEQKAIGAMEAWGDAAGKIHKLND